MICISRASISIFLRSLLCVLLLVLNQDSDLVVSFTFTFVEERERSEWLRFLDLKRGFGFDFAFDESQVAEMARKKIREYDSKRLLKEHFKRLCGRELPIKSAQVSHCYCVSIVLRFRSDLKLLDLRRLSFVISSVYLVVDCGYVCIFFFIDLQFMSQD